MAWQNVGIAYAETYINTSLYTYVQWSRKLNVAAKDGIDESRTYATANSYSITATGDPQYWTVAPGPSNDPTFIEFTTLKALCTIHRSELINASRNSALVKDGTTTIDNRGAANTVPYVGTFCDIYNEKYEAKYGTGYVVISNFALERYSINYQG